MELHTDVLIRDQVPVSETWDLTALYADDAAWHADASRIEGLVAAVNAHRESLGASPAALLTALEAVTALRQTVERLVVYAELRYDEDMTHPDSAVRRERAQALETAVNEGLAFLEPALLAIPSATLEELVGDPSLAPYRGFLHRVARRRPHVRSQEVEELLAHVHDLVRGPEDAFLALDNADLEFGTIQDSTGTEVPLTRVRYSQILETSLDREMRRRAHEGLNAVYLAHRHTLATLLSTSVRKDTVLARARGFASARADALFMDDVPEVVYDNLIVAVRAARPIIERYLALRRRALGVEPLTNYDLHLDLSLLLAPPEAERWSWTRVVEAVVDGLRPLGDRYCTDLRAGLTARWVDVHETRGKFANGAYSLGNAVGPPYILLNWAGTWDDVFVLAHELGHAMHSHYAATTQPYHDVLYSGMLAETASTVNEVVLMRHSSRDDAGRHRVLLARFADTCLQRLVFPTMAADYEHRIHAMVEAGEPLTLDSAMAAHGDVFADYLPGVEVDDAVRIAGLRRWIFYRPFYSYWYATGFTAATTLVRQMLDEGEPAVQRYLALLAAGGSDFPIALLRRAGVDLTTPVPVQAAFTEWEHALAELEDRIAPPNPGIAG